jgi:hypothetical protein
MNDNFKQELIDIINNQQEITLNIGENEYYIDTEKYSIQIEYSLEEYDACCDNPNCTDKYIFNVLDIFVIDKDTDEEFTVEPNDDIENALYEGSNIEDWNSDDSDEVIDDYFNSDDE